MNNTRIGMFLVGLLILLLTVTHAGATTVSIADETVEPGNKVTIPIMVNEITDYGSGTINIEYNSSVVHVTDATSSPDSQVAAYNANNTIGLVQISASNVYGVNGDVAFANVEFTAVGNSGDWTPLDLTVVSLYDRSFNKISATTSDGSITVGAAADPQLCANPEHNFGTVQPGQTETRTFDVTNCGGAGTLTWTVSGDPAWITVSPTSGTGADTVTVTINTTWLSDGTHTGTVTVASDYGTETGTITVDVQSTQTDPQLCTTPDPPSHDFGSVPEGETRTWTFDVTNCGTGTLDWSVSVSDSRPWITISPASGSTTGTDIVTVTINTTGLAAGSTYSGDVTATSDHGTKTGTISVSIPLGQEDPQLCTTPDPPAHDFGSVPEGETRTWTFDVTNCGGVGTLTWTVGADRSWITVSPTGGTNTDTVTVTINTTGLSDGTHTGIVTITSDYGTKTGTITVDVQSTQEDPKLCANPEHNFGTVQPGQTETWQFDVTNCGGAGTLAWTASDNRDWITVSPTSGTDAGTVTVAIDTASLTPGTHTGTVTVESNGGTKTGTITVKVKGSQPLPPPADVPTFTPIGMFALVGLLGIAGIGVIKRR